MGGEQIEPEHLLIALLRADRGVLPKILTEVGVLYGETRLEIRGRWGERARLPTTAEIPLSEQTERIFELAEEEAGEGTVGTGQLLIGILQAENSIAAEILRSRG